MMDYLGRLVSLAKAPAAQVRPRTWPIFVAPADFPSISPGITVDSESVSEAPPAGPASVESGRPQIASGRQPDSRGDASPPSAAFTAPALAAPSTGPASPNAAHNSGLIPYDPLDGGRVVRRREHPQDGVSTNQAEPPSQRALKPHSPAAGRSHRRAQVEFSDVSAIIGGGSPGEHGAARRGEALQAYDPFEQDPAVVPQVHRMVVARGGEVSHHSGAMPPRAFRNGAILQPTSSQKIVVSIGRVEVRAITTPPPPPPQPPPAGPRVSLDEYLKERGSRRQE